MATPTYVDHVEEGRALLPSQWDEYPQVLALLDSLLRPLDELETTSQELISTLLDVYTATGVQLDQIGALFSKPRNNRLDPEYRASILSAITEAKSDGTTEVFIQNARTLTSSDDVRMYEHFPASIFLRLGGSWGNETWANLDAKTPAGADLVLLLDYDLQSLVFSERLLSQANLVNDAGNQIVTDVGGQISNVVVQVNATGAKASSGGIFSELGTLTPDALPLAEMASKSYPYITGLLVDENAINLTDMSGDTITYTEFGEIIETVVFEALEKLSFDSTAVTFDSTSHTWDQKKA